MITHLFCVIIFVSGRNMVRSGYFFAILNYRNQNNEVLDFVEEFGGFPTNVEFFQFVESK